MLSRILASLKARLSTLLFTPPQLRLHHMVNRKCTPSLSLWRTLYINFCFLPIRQALRLPIYVYGRTRIHNPGGLGCIRFLTPDGSLPRRGTVTIGTTGPGSRPNGSWAEIYLVRGTLQFNIQGGVENCNINLM